MTSGNTQGLDEILSDMAFRCAGGITENGGKEYLPAKQAILQWVNDEVIGDNVRWNYTERMQYSTREADALDYMFAVNRTKDDQRNVLKQHGFKQEGDQ